MTPTHELRALNAFADALETAIIKHRPVFDVPGTGCLPVYLVLCEIRSDCLKYRNVVWARNAPVQS